MERSFPRPPLEYLPVQDMTAVTPPPIETTGTPPTNAVAEQPVFDNRFLPNRTWSDGSMRMPDLSTVTQAGPNQPDRDAPQYIKGGWAISRKSSLTGGRLTSSLFPQESSQMSDRPPLHGPVYVPQKSAPLPTPNSTHNPGTVANPAKPTTTPRWAAPAPRAVNAPWDTPAPRPPVAPWAAPEPSTINSIAKAGNEQDTQPKGLEAYMPAPAAVALRGLASAVRTHANSPRQAAKSFAEWRAQTHQRRSEGWANGDLSKLGWRKYTAISNPIKSGKALVEAERAHKWSQRASGTQDSSTPANS